VRASRQACAGRPPATGAHAAVSSAVSRAGPQLATSSSRADAAPNRASRGDRCPTIASRVLTARYTVRPVIPPAAPHTSGETMASPLFSATDSITARVICWSSSRCGSRPQRLGSPARAAARSPSASAVPIRAASELSDRAPVTAQVAAAVAPSASHGRPRVSRPAATAGAAPSATHTAVYPAPRSPLSA
jgi:hypothetical protein